MQARPAEAVPHHVAVIMDGNGRWARQRGLSRSDGHRAGLETAREIVRAADDLGVGWLTLYAFSSENWRRPRREIDALMTLPGEYFDQELPEAQRRGMRVLAIGDPARLPRKVQRTVEHALAATANNTGMRLVFALSYGGRAEIVNAARRLLQAQQEGAAPVPEALDEARFAAYLDQPDMPDVDLLIRTGCEQRVSNFLLWQIAYAELAMTASMWPDFNRAEFEKMLAEYSLRERRFGRTPDQVEGP